MAVPALSLAHYRLFMERSVGPMERLVASLAGDPERLAALRREYEQISAPYFTNNVISQEYLLTKAAAKA